MPTGQKRTLAETKAITLIKTIGASDQDYLDALNTINNAPWFRAVKGIERAEIIRNVLTFIQSTAQPELCLMGLQIVNTIISKYKIPSSLFNEVGFDPILFCLKEEQTPAVKEIALKIILTCCETATKPMRQLIKDSPHVFSRLLHILKNEPPLFFLAFELFNLLTWSLTSAPDPHIDLFTQDPSIFAPIFETDPKLNIEKRLEVAVFIFEKMNQESEAVNLLKKSVLSLAEYLVQLDMENLQHTNADECLSSTIRSDLIRIFSMVLASEARKGLITAENCEALFIYLINLTYTESNYLPFNRHISGLQNSPSIMPVELNYFIFSLLNDRDVVLKLLAGKNLKITYWLNNFLNLYFVSADLPASKEWLPDLKLSLAENDNPLLKAAVIGPLWKVIASVANTSNSIEVFESVIDSPFLESILNQVDYLLTALGNDLTQYNFFPEEFFLDEIKEPTLEKLLFQPLQSVCSGVKALVGKFQIAALPKFDNSKK